MFQCVVLTDQKKVNRAGAQIERRLTADHSAADWLASSVHATDLWPGGAQRVSCSMWKPRRLVHQSGSATVRL